MRFKRKHDADNIFKLYVEGLNPPDTGELDTDTGSQAADQLQGGSEERDSLVNRRLAPRRGIDALSTVGGRVSVDPKRLSYSIKRYYFKQIKGTPEALLIYGEPGIGKTQIVQQTARELAASQNKTFVQWEQIGQPGQPSEQDIEADPSQFFVLMDKSTGDMAPEEIGGFPSPFEGESQFTKLKPMEWTKYMIMQGLHGIIFFDEIGHASEDVQRVLFKIINERKLGGKTPIASGMAMLAATNLPDSISGSNDIAAPLINRFNVVQLIPDPKAWGAYARQAGVHPLVIAYANHDPSVTFYLDPEKMDPSERAQYADSQQFPTPRTITMFGQALNQVLQLADKVIESPESLSEGELEMIQHEPAFEGLTTGSGVDMDELWTGIFHEAAQKCGEKWARGFQAYVTQYLSINWKHYLANPAKIADSDMDPYILTGLMVYMATAIEREFRDANVKDAVMHAKMAKQSGQPLQIPTYDAIIEMMYHMDSDKRMIAFVNNANHNKDAAMFFLKYIDHGDYNPKLKQAWVGDGSTASVDPQSLLGELIKQRSELGSLVKGDRDHVEVKTEPKPEPKPEPKRPTTFI